MTTARTIWELDHDHPLWRLLRTVVVGLLTYGLCAVNCNDLSWDETLQAIQTVIAFGGGQEIVHALNNRGRNDAAPDGATPG